MKTNKILLGALRVSALAALFAMTPAQAQTVNVELLNNTVPDPTSGTYTGVAAASDLGTYWNAIAATPYGTPSFTNSTTLKQSNGSTTSAVSFRLTSTSGLFGLSSAGATFADPLMNEWINPGNGSITAGNPASLTITGLSPFTVYNLYLYSQNGSEDYASTSFNFGSVKTATNTESDTSFVAGANYVEFTLVANGSGDISGTYYLAEGGSIEGINGFQIQSVPEPASLATMSLVGIAMLVFCKRFKKQSV